MGVYGYLNASDMGSTLHQISALSMDWNTSYSTEKRMLDLIIRIQITRFVFTLINIFKSTNQLTYLLGIVYNPILIKN